MRISKKDVSEARRVYWLLLFAPLYGLIPCAGFLAVFVVLLFILVWAFSKKTFIAAHARQGLLLGLVELTLGILILFFSFSSSSSSAGLLTVTAIGVWIIGNLGGLIQAGNGRTWIGGIQAEILASSGQVLLADVSLVALKKNESVEHYLDLFRTGDRASRQHAINQLRELGQVEVF